MAEMANRQAGRRSRRAAGATATLALIAALAGPLPAQAQDTIGIAAGTDPGPALAPTAPLIGMSPVADGTESATAPRPGIAPRQDVTLTGTADTGMGEDAATVLADSITLTGDSTLIATGGVVVWYQGARLVASRLVVDGASGDLTLQGPIHLSQPNAAPGTADDSILIADSAQIDRKLQDGILRGARLVIARELQLAAREVQRSDGGRLTRLTQVVASSCQICAADPTPLWEIRARSIVHDAERQALILENPQLRAFGVPIAALPFTITAPDPSVDRRTGFLRPRFRTTSNLGFGVKLPYFVTLGRHADVTLTPYLSASQTRTLETRYRQAFSNGAVQINAAISRDDVLPGETRGYVFGAAQFELPRGYRLGVQLQHVSDRGYLLDYDISDADRLWSGLTLDRVRRDKLFVARIGNYETLRSDEDQATSPAQVADVIWQRRLNPALIGGEALLEWSIHAHRRPSSVDIAGRDMARGSLGMDWRRSQILPGGLVGAALASVDADIYRVAQDSRFDDFVTRVTPMAGVELRWPLMGHAGGATHIVEPVAQVLWSPRRDDTGDPVPNDDARLIEFDEGNLFSANRFPGWDAREAGLRANLGVSWTRIDPTGWSLGVTAGRVWRDRADDAFGPDSPLSGRRSDWLVTTHFDSGDGMVVANRALFDSDLQFSRNELRLGVLRPDFQMSAGYLWIDRDRGESRDFDVSELTLAGGWQAAPGWWLSAEGRYDFRADSLRKAALGAQFRNECLTLDMGVSRRFTTSDTLRPETDFGLSVRLGGFGRADDGPGTVARRSCMR